MCQNAIRDLEAMRRSNRHLEFAIVSALIWFHQKADIIDEEELRRLDAVLKTAKSCIHVDGALLAADFYFHVADYEAASVCLKFQVVMKLHQNHYDDSDMVSTEANIESCRIQLWLAIAGFKQTSGNSIISIMSVLEKNVCDQENIDVIMAQAK